MKKDLSLYTDRELLRYYGESRQPEYLIELYGRYTSLVYGVVLKYLKNIPAAKWEGRGTRF